MNEQIRQLLNRFLDGTTTLSEEARLADYFRTHEVSDEWQAYKDMFALFDSGSVEAGTQSDAAADVVPLPSVKSHRWIWTVAACAACVAAAVAIAVGMMTDEPAAGNMPAPQIAQVTPPVDIDSARCDTIETATQPSAMGKSSQEPPRPKKQKTVRRKVSDIIKSPLTMPDYQVAQAAPADTAVAPQSANRPDPQLVATNSMPNPALPAYMQIMASIEDMQRIGEEISREFDERCRAISNSAATICTASDYGTDDIE